MDRTARPTTISRTSTVIKDYEVNRQSALEEKMASCSKDHMTVRPADPNNFYIDFSIAVLSFEYARQSIMHSSTGDQAPRPGRHLEITNQIDNKGTIDTELIWIQYITI